MSILLFADNAVSQLASGITNVALTATLTAGSGSLFPAPGAGQYFKATFVDAATGTVFEIVHVTAVVGDTITMVRGQEGTSAHAWLAGDSFFMAPTAGTMQAMVQAEQLQSGTYSTGVAGGTANALTVTVPSTRTTAADGMALTVIASAPNSSTASIVVTLGSTTLGSVALVKLNNNTLAPGDIPAAGYPIELVYSATFGAWVMQNPASGGLVTAGVSGKAKNYIASATGTNATVSIAFDELCVGNSAGQYRTLHNKTFSINSAGTVGQPLSLSTGVLAANTWYAVWVWDNGTTQTAMLDPSSSSPTAPAGYSSTDYNAWRGWIKTDGTGNKYPLAFTQAGDVTHYVVGANVTGLFAAASGVLGSPTTPTWVSAQVQANTPTSGYVPSTAKKVRVLLTSGANSSAMAAPSDAYGVYNSTSNPPPLVTSCASTSRFHTEGMLLLESINLYYAGDNAANGLYIMGWEDNL